MSQVPVDLVVAAFQDESGADRILGRLQAAKREREIGIEMAAVLRRDANNKLHISETADWNRGKGAAAGALIGGAIGMLFPPSILVTGILGAAIGSLAVRLRDTGFPDAQLKKLGASLKPGTSAILAVVEHEHTGALEHELARDGAQTVREAIEAEVSAQLQPKHELVQSPSAEEDAPNKPGQAAMTGEAVTANEVVSDAQGAAVASSVKGEEETVQEVSRNNLSQEQSAASGIKPTSATPAAGEVSKP